MLNLVRSAFASASVLALVTIVMFIPAILTILLELKGNLAVVY